MVPSSQPTKRGANKKPQKTGRKAEATPKEEEFTIKIGPPRLTRFEKARIIGARSLQLALGAPPFIPLPPTVTDPISLAISEIEARALPISIRRMLPNGEYQDIPLDCLLLASWKGP